MSVRLPRWCEVHCSSTALRAHWPRGVVFAAIGIGPVNALDLVQAQAHAVVVHRQDAPARIDHEELALAETDRPARVHEAPLTAGTWRVCQVTPEWARSGAFAPGQGLLGNHVIDSANVV